MLGQLQDAGNTTTLAHYLDMLETAFLKDHHSAMSLIVGSGGMPLTAFFSEHPRDILRG